MHPKKNLVVGDDEDCLIIFLIADLNVFIPDG